MPRWVKPYLTAGQNWSSDNAFQHSAAVSYYTMFSLAPILIIAVAIAGLFLGHDQAARQMQEQLTGLVGAESAKMLVSTMQASQSKHANIVSTIIGVSVLLVGATSVFGQLQDSLNQIWSVKTKPSKSGLALLVIRRLISFAMVVVVGFLLLVSLVVSTAVTALMHSFDSGTSLPKGVVQTVEVVVSLGVITVLFAFLFKVLPDVLLRWREVWKSAVLTAVLFSVGRYLIAIYLSHSTVASVYGAAGSLVALVVWIYYSCAILFYGVEYLKAAHIEAGELIRPKATAVLVKQEVVEEKKEARLPRKARAG